MQDMDAGAVDGANQFGALFKELGDALDAPEMEPNAARKEWPEQAIHRLLARYQDLLKVLPAALSSAPEEALANRLRDDVGLMAGEVATLAHLAGIKSDRDKLFRLGLELQITPTAREQLRAGQAHPDAYAHLIHGLWLARAKRDGEADHAMKRVLSSTKDDTLRELAQHILDRPKPLTGAPALFRLNGFGFGLYGSRDRQPDGSYIATYCVSAVWVPVFPLTAYRVRSEGDGRYTFFAKQRLSRFASTVRLAIPALVALVVIASAISSHYDSPAYRAGQAFDVAEAVEQAGDPAEALMAYEQVTREWSGTDASRRATAAVLRLMEADIPDPPTVEGVESVARVLRRAQQARFDLRGDAREALRARADAYMEGLGQGTEKTIFARLRLLPLERELWTSDDGLTDQEQALRVALGDLYRERWPADALRQYASAFPAPDAVSHAEPCVRQLMESSSCLRDAAPDLQAFAQANSSASGETMRALAAAVAEVADDSARAEALSSDDIERLRALVQERPQDQELLAALVRDEQGDERGQACAKLAALGDPGMLIAGAQVARALCLRDAGELVPATELLSHHVNVRLPAYQEASAAYDARAHARLMRWGEMADRGEFAPDLESQLRSASRDEAPQIYAHWVREQLANDHVLSVLRERMERYGAVVPAALHLGMLELSRAQSESGETREALLADAERVLLAIAEQAAEVPAFHVTLGQVYFRLGRDAEGARELDTVAAGGDPRLVLSVSETYRELGQTGRARDIARGVLEGDGDESLRQQAATLLSQMADNLDDEVDWLTRAPGRSPSLDAQRSQAQARQALRDGDEVAADRLYAQALRYWEHDTQQDAVSANNAALIYEERYQCTGNPAMLHRATQGLEHAVRLEPGNSLLLENMLVHLQYDATMAQLGRDTRLTELRPTLAEASSLASLFGRGDDHDARIAALRRPMGRVVELARQAQVLAPRRAAAYMMELAWIGRADDAEGLASLATRVGRLPVFDDASAQERRVRWLAGELDEGEATRARAQLIRGNARVVAAGRDRHTLALARYLRAREHGAVFSITREMSEIEANVADLRAAVEAWPELHIGRDLAWALFSQGVMRAAADNAALRSAVDADWRRFSMRWSVHRALSGSSADEIRRSLQAQPDAREALALLRADPSRKPSLSVWVLATDLQDGELASAHEAARRDAFQRSIAELAQRLSPLDEEASAMVALYTRE